MRITRVFQLILALLFMLAMSSALQASERSGEEVYDESCGRCHGWIGSMMSDAPRTGNEEVWQVLETKGLDELVRSTINGFGEMPAKGNCEDCTDSEIQAAVEYILEESR